MATLRALTRWAVLTSLFAAVLFIVAGSTEVPSLRNYVAVLSALLLFTMVAVDPELARERARPAGRDIDPGSRTASGFLYLATVIFAAWMSAASTSRTASRPTGISPRSWCLRRR